MPPTFRELTTLASSNPSSHRCGADILSRTGRMVDNDEKITRVLFCGPHFSASQDYTREYLNDYPFVQLKLSLRGHMRIDIAEEMDFFSPLPSGAYFVERLLKVQVDDVPLADVPDVIEKYDICIVKSMKLDFKVLACAKKMKLIMQYGVGLEGVEIDAATKFGIKVARIPSHATGNSASCAEMAIYLMLGLLRKQNELQISIKQRKLGDPIGETLLGKTVFILGFGNIGIDLAKRLKPFGVKIIATKRKWDTQSDNSCQSNGDLVDEKGGHEDVLKFASNADIVVCCLCLNSETVGIVNKAFISSMRKGALLVNIARGGLLNYEAVLYYLKSGYLGGLGIDVAWTEPFDPDDPILKFNNVLITPHVAGVTEYSYRSMSKVVGDVAIQLHEGKPLTGVEFVN